MRLTKYEALHWFYSRFGLDAYEENIALSMTDRDLPRFPYLTYSVSLADFWAGEIPLTVDLWYRGTSWIPAYKKANEISRAIGPGGVCLPCDDGYIWLKRGTPFSNNLSDPNDDEIRRININITAEFTTKD